MENSQNRIKIKETIIVEGKYDKIRLSPLFDANIIELGGFRIYNNKDRLALIRRIAEKNGIIILTDSDSAGFRLRHYLSSAVPKERITNVFIPDVSGKEKRKAKPGKENLIGVEGMKTEVLLDAFRKAGISVDGAVPKGKRPLPRRIFLNSGFPAKKIPRSFAESSVNIFPFRRCFPQIPLRKFFRYSPTRRSFFPPLKK